jgi:protein SCO1/2
MNQQQPRTFPWTIAIGLMLLLMTVALAALVIEVRSRVARRHSALPVLGQVSDFNLTNQLGSAVSLRDVTNHVWVADIIFTRCPGPCMRMTRQMNELQSALPANGKTKLVSLTTDPDYDTPAVLARYAADKGNADTNRWMFFTGTKKEIGNLAIDGLKLTAVEKKPEERESSTDLFIHSTIFVVVDRHGKLRGVYETGGEGVDWSKSKQQILADVRQLEREP